ncbi:unnamed protein product [Gongylonema pulchrum]|uniref:Uncharacterized protein n=1 Tax=Gongylonema pulchrum TaxID=637853 RepID=A0A183EDW2_9BILA|nr:unnamed protein product [Gongylonema pulchrum]
MTQAGQEFGRNFLDDTAQGFAVEGHRLATDLDKQAPHFFQTSASIIRAAVNETQRVVRVITIILFTLAILLLLMYVGWKYICDRYRLYRQRKKSQMVAKYINNDRRVHFSDQPQINYSSVPEMKEMKDGEGVNSSGSTPTDRTTVDIIDFLPQIHSLMSIKEHRYRLPYVRVPIDGQYRLCLFDTDSTITYIRKSIVPYHKWEDLQSVGKTA